MTGAIIGDLEAWTWENEHEKFYPYLVAENAQKSRYSDVILFASDTLLNNPGISRNEFMRLYLCHFGDKDHETTSRYALLCSIVVGWLYERDKISEAVHSFCLSDEKEALYACLFMAKLICELRHGSTKKEAAQTEFCGTLRSFTKEEHWKTGNGVLSYLVRAWMSFYDAFDYGSTIHNAIHQPGDMTLNCILAGALADAMYGSENYFVKEKYEGGRFINKPEYLNWSVCDKYRKMRTFFPKNNARTNVERHTWKNAPCPFSDKVINKELKYRILKAFYTGWEDRYGFYLDDGWIYVYRSFILLARFQLKELEDGTYRIINYQKNEKSIQIDEGDIAINCAMHPVEHRWDLVSDKSVMNQ